MTYRAASATHCRRGHPYTADNTIAYSKNRCRTCRSAQRHSPTRGTRLPVSFWIERLSDVLASVTETPDGCWIWTGARDRGGYAQVSYGGRIARVHRLIYRETVGPIADGLTLDHTCHNAALALGECAGGKCAHRACVNPAHLEPVTVGENSARARSARRRFRLIDSLVTAPLRAPLGRGRHQDAEGLLQPSGGG